MTTTIIDEIKQAEENAAARLQEAQVSAETRLKEAHTAAQQQIISVREELAQHVIRETTAAKSAAEKKYSHLISETEANIALLTQKMTAKKSELKQLVLETLAQPK